MSPNVVVIGAGIAGLACARILRDRGADVTLLDKGRAPGGRVTTRRRSEHAFDLGAQYFTVRDARFARRVEALRRGGAVAPWDATIVALEPATGEFSATGATERFVGVPGMSALPLAMAQELGVRASHRVEQIASEGRDFFVEVSVARAGVTLSPTGMAARHVAVANEPLERARLGPFDAVAMCMPPSQAAGLVGEHARGLAGRLATVELVPCFSLGAAFEAKPAEDLAALPFDGAFIGRENVPSTSILSWIARDSSKPGRSEGERWVIHACEAFSRSHYQESEESVTARLLAEFHSVLGIASGTPAFTTLQRWGLARAVNPLAEGALVDRDARVGIGGDWAAGGRVEGAYLSGVALAEQLAWSLS